MFGEILNKLSKQYRVPSIEELRYSEIYEFTFARRNAQYDSGFNKSIAQHDKFSQYLNVNPNSSLVKNKQLDDLSIGQAEEHVSASLARLSFFPHLLVYKVAICGLGRRLCASNQDLAYNLLLYLE